MFLKNKQRFMNFMFLFITVLSWVLGCAETDIYAPSFPDMLAHFNTTETKIQMLISLNFLGLCFSSLVYGPLSDALGRRSLTLFGLFIMMVASIGCAVTKSIDILLAYRFIQGLGIGALWAISPASLMDRYSPEKAGQIMAILGSFVTFALAAAPILGGWINLTFGWHANFFLIAAMSIITFVLFYFFFDETLKEDKRLQLNWKQLAKNYWTIGKNFQFFANSSIYSLVSTTLIIYISNLSFIFINNLKMDPTVYTFYQASILGTHMFVGFFTSRVIKHKGNPFTKTLGMCTITLGAILFLITLLFNPNDPVWITVSMMTVSGGMSLACTVAYINALEPFEHMRGAAASLASTFRLLFCALLVAFSGPLFDGTIRPVAILIILSIFLSLILYAMVQKRTQAQLKTA